MTDEHGAADAWHILPGEGCRPPSMSNHALGRVAAVQWSRADGEVEVWRGCLRCDSDSVTCIPLAVLREYLRELDAWLAKGEVEP